MNAFYSKETVETHTALLASLLSPTKKRRLHPHGASLLFQQFKILIFVSNIYYSAGAVTFHTPAAKAPPTNGPTMNIHK